MKNRQKPYSQIRYLKIFLILFIDLIGILTFLHLIRVPSDNLGAFLFGYSISRLGVLAIIAIGPVLASCGVFWLVKWSDLENTERIISALNSKRAVIILWAIFFLEKKFQQISQRIG